MKLAAQTVCAYERTPCYYARYSSTLPLVVQQLTSDLKRACNTDSAVTLSVRPEEYHVGNGFMKSLMSPPCSEIEVVLPPDGVCPVLYCGQRPPQWILVGSYMYSLESVDYPALDFLDVQSSLLRLLTTQVTDLKVAAVAKKDHEPALNFITTVAKAIKQANLNIEDLKSATPSKRAFLMKSKRRLVHELETLVGGLVDELRIAKSVMNSDQQALWLNKVTSMKYGSRALRRAKEVACTQVIADLRQLPMHSFSRLPSDLTSCLSMRSAVEHIQEIVEVNSLSTTSLTALLYRFGMVGILITVHRSEAATVDPWAINVQYVSSDIGDTASAMCALDSLALLTDSSGNTVSDVLVIIDPCNPAPGTAFLKTKLHDIYTAVIFTRNPDICIHSQKTALMMNALVRATGQLLDPKYRNRANLNSVLRILYTLRVRCKSTGESYWHSMLGKLMQPQPGKYMTEAEEDDVSSVSKILGAMCAFPEILASLGLLDQKNFQQLSDVAFSLLAETASRGCRIMLKVSLCNDAMRNL